MKGVIYARYSSDHQREESIEGQIRECTVFAEKNGITLLHTYTDHAFSARTDNRPAFQKMIKDSHQKMFDVILVWKLDRFARDRFDSAHYKHLLKKNGFVLYRQPSPSQTDPTALLLKRCLRVWLNTTPPSLLRKSIAV